MHPIPGENGNLPGTKALLRRRLLSRLGVLDPSEHSRRSAALRDALAGALAARNPGNLAVFLPLPTEPDLLPLWEIWRAAGWRLSLPIITGPTTLSLVACPPVDETWVRGPLGVRTPPEPWQPFPEEGLSVVLLPALAVSPGGARLGRGGGFYDRWLARLPAHCLRIAIVFDCQVEQEVPAESWDEPVQAWCTESGYRELPPPA